jgi:hypothetical protein
MFAQATLEPTHNDRKTTKRPNFSWNKLQKAKKVKYAKLNTETDEKYTKYLCKSSPL